MRIRFLAFVASATALFLTASSASAQLAIPARFDMGEVGGPVAAGYVAVTPASTYSASAGFGWSLGSGPIYLTPPTAATRPAPHTNVKYVPANAPEAVLRDFCDDTKNYTFRALVQPTTSYDCVVYLGDLGDPPTLPTPLQSMQVRVNGTTVVTSAFARTVVEKATLNGSWGGYKRCTFTAESNASGHLDFKFMASATRRVPVMSIEIYAHSAPPLSFDHATKALVAAPAHQTALQPFLNALANPAATYPHYGAARAALDAISGNDLAKAWGYAWLSGWLTGDEEDVDLDLFDPTDPGSIEALLVGLTQPNDFAVASLLAATRDFAKGELFVRSRGYTTDAIPNPENIVLPFDGVTGDIVRNSCAGIQLLEQLDDDLLDLAASPLKPECPYFPKAQYLLARSAFGRNTNLHLDIGQCVGCAKDFNLYFLGVMDRVWLRVEPSGPELVFPWAADAAVFAWYLRTLEIPGTGGPRQPWDGVSLPPIAYGTPASPTTWWTDETQFAVPAGMTPPAWAEKQWRYARTLRNLAAWWSVARAKGTDGGQWGGGGGDDVEGAAALAIPLIAVDQGAASTAESGITKVLEHVLFGPEVNQEEGYVDPDPPACLPPGSPGYMDAEHAAEYTTYPLFYFLPARYGQPKYLEFAMRTIRNLDQAPDPVFGDVAWSGMPAWSSWRHLKAWVLGANAYEKPGGPCNNGNVDIDITENMKSLIPGFTLVDYALNPKAVSLWYEYAQAWAAAGLSTAQAKPSGVFPVGVDYSDGSFGVGGPTGPWYVVADPDGGEVGLHHADIYYAQTLAYRTNPQKPPAERARLLAPLRDAILFVNAPPAGDPAAPLGSDAWTKSMIQGQVARAAVAGRVELESVLGMNPQDIDLVIANHGNAYANYLSAPLVPGQGKDEQPIVDMFADNATWMRHLWPMSTTTVSFTDRLKFIAEVAASKGNAISLLETRGGAVFQVAPVSLVSWSNPDPQGQGELDLAILVSYADTGAASTELVLKALVYNFATTAVDVDLMALRLPPGTYHLNRGNDLNGDDFIDQVTQSAITIDGYGTPISITAVPSGVVHVIDLEMTMPSAGAPSLKADPAVGTDDLRLDPQGKLVVVVHNLGSADLSAGTTTLDVRDATTSALLGTATVPFLAAPVDLTPRSTVVLTTVFPVPGQGIEVEIHTSASQVTALNDIAVKVF